MPRIIVTDDDSTLACDPAATLAERVSLKDLESRHFSEHLLERVRWALADLGERSPRRSPRPEAEPAPAQRSASVVTTAS